MTDAQPGAQDWLKYYPAAHSAVFKDLDEDELEECQTLAEEWNTTGPSAEKQAKFVSFLFWTFTKSLK
jgi:inosine/xanthosine triphosphate pyrophosphatase family protein